MSTALVIALIQIGVTLGPQFVAGLISLFQQNKDSVAEITPEQIEALKLIVKDPNSYFPPAA